MLTIARNLAVRVWAWWDRLFGDEHFDDVSYLGSVNELRVISIAGHGLNVRIERRAFRQTRGCRFSITRLHVCYRVTSTPLGDVPESFRVACELILTVPRLLPAFCYEHQQQAKAIDAYLSLLVSRLRQRN